MDVSDLLNACRRMLASLCCFLLPLYITFGFCIVYKILYNALLIPVFKTSISLGEIFIILGNVLNLVLPINTIIQNSIYEHRHHYQWSLLYL